MASIPAGAITTVTAGDGLTIMIIMAGIPMPTTPIGMATEDSTTEAATSAMVPRAHATTVVGRDAPLPQPRATEIQEAVTSRDGVDALPRATTLISMDPVLFHPHATPARSATTASAAVRAAVASEEALAEADHVAAVAAVADRAAESAWADVDDKNCRTLKNYNRK